MVRMASCRSGGSKGKQGADALPVKLGNRIDQGLAIPHRRHPLQLRLDGFGTQRIDGASSIQEA